MARTPFKLRSGNTPLKQNVFDKEGRSDLGPSTTIQQAASKGKSAWQVLTERNRPKYGTSYGQSMDTSKKTLGRGISNFFGKLKKTIKPRNIGAELQKKYKGRKQTTDRAGSRMGFSSISDKKDDLISFEKWNLGQTQEKRSKRINRERP